MLTILGENNPWRVKQGIEGGIIIIHKYALRYEDSNGDTLYAFCEDYIGAGPYYDSLQHYFNNILDSLGESYSELRSAESFKTISLTFQGEEFESVREIDNIIKLMGVSS